MSLYKISINTNSYISTSAPNAHREWNRIDRMSGKLLLILATTLLLSACGFQLRGSANLPYETLHVASPNASTFVNELKRAISTGTKTRVIDQAKEAQATLQVLTEAREKAILALSGGGRVREFQLRYRVTYRVVDKNNRDLLPATQIALHRDLSYNDTDTLSKESEEILLYRDMQTDAVSQLLRQLQHGPQRAAAR